MKNSKQIVGTISAIAILVSSVFVFNTSDQKLDSKSNKLQAVMIHTSASREGKDVKAHQIVNYHLRSKDKGGRGWSKPGYSVIIELDGNTVITNSYDDDDVITYSEITNGAVGMNRIMRHICYIGGLDSTGKKAKNTLTHAQDSAMKVYVLNFIETYPHSYVCGHNQFAKKACPSFDVPEKCLEWGVPIPNIWKINSKYKIPEKYGKVIFKD